MTLETLHTDIVIIGGGSAGIAAAYGAAQFGLRVVLIEKQAYLGGLATTAEVGTICGLYAYNKAPESRYITNGFARDFAERIAVLSESVPQSNREGMHYLPYNIGAFKTLGASILDENNVTFLSGAELLSVEVTGQHITSVVVLHNGQEQRIHLEAIIDTSGMSVVSRLAHATLLPTKNYQAASQVFTLRGIALEDETNLSFALMRAVAKAIQNGDLDEHYRHLHVVQGSLIHGTASFKLLLPVEITHLEKDSIALELLARQMVETAVEALQTQNSSAFSGCSLKSIASGVGIRLGFRPLGKYVLTEEDVLSCKKSDSGIANGSWPIEEWAVNQRVQIRDLVPDDYYQVPADCLLSAEIDNLYFAGRNISATDAAIGSARVMGICLQTGFAAGYFASGRIKQLSDSDIIAKIRAAQIETT